MIELDRSTEEHYGAKLKIVGVGGGGGNAVNSMIERGLAGCEFLAVNTDMQALAKNAATIKVQVGKELTRGLGAGANPSIGRDASEESREELIEALTGSDMVFVTAGMGGGTGTGGAPVVAEVARSLGALVVGIVTKPFNWEGKRRRDQSELGIEQLKEHVDTLIVVPNQKLLSIIDKKTGFKQGFQMVDDVLYNATSGIAKIITGHGIVNVDFADVRTVMENMGEALMGTGTAAGEDRAVEAAQNAISSPLLEGVSIAGSQGVLINIAASSELTMMEVDEAVQIVHDAVGTDANIIFGVVLDDELEDKMLVTVIATGFNKAEVAKKAPSAGTAAAQSQQKVQTLQPREEEQPQQERIAAQGRPWEAKNERVPVGLDELEKFNEPAYMRRGTGIHRGGYDITKRREDTEPKREEEQQQYVEEEQKVARRKTAEKPAFLRRIMD